MLNIRVVALLFCFVIVLSACRVEWRPAPEETPEGNPLEVVEKKDTNGEMNTEIQVIGKAEGSSHIWISGDSNLPEGAVLSLVIQQYEDRKDFTEGHIVKGEQPTGPIIGEGEIIISEEGTFRGRVRRKVIEEYSKLTVTFRPEKQSKEIQDIYGVHGENISNSDNSITNIHYELDGQQYTGYQVYGSLDIMHATSSLLSSYEK